MVRVDVYVPSFAASLLAVRHPDLKGRQASVSTRMCRTTSSAGTGFDEIVPMRPMTRYLPQEHRLHLGLDALGDDVHPQRVPQADDGRDDAAREYDAVAVDVRAREELGVRIS